MLIKLSGMLKMGDLSRNFSRREFKCQCNDCNYDTVDSELISVLEDIRQHFGEPVTINSGNRCPAHNRSVGGGASSQHLYGRAADIVVENIDPDSVALYLKMLYAGKYGIGTYSSFTHIDTRSNGPARW